MGALDADFSKNGCGIEIARIVTAVAPAFRSSTRRSMLSVPMVCQPKCKDGGARVTGPCCGAVSSRIASHFTNFAFGGFVGRPAQPDAPQS